VDCYLPEVTWRHAGDVFEDSGEVALVGKASGKRNSSKVSVGQR
jgi:hypothetical protein